MLGAEVQLPIGCPASSLMNPKSKMKMPWFIVLSMLTFAPAPLVVEAEGVREPHVGGMEEAIARVDGRPTHHPAEGRQVRIGRKTTSRLQLRAHAVCRPPVTAHGVCLLLRK